MISVESPRAVDGRAPDVFRKGGWVPMKVYADDEAVDFAVVGTGAGGGTLTYKLASAGFRVVAFDAGPFWRPLEEFASDEKEQQKLYWSDERIVAGDDAIQLGANNSGRGVGGSTVHFTMLTPRFRPEWFKCRRYSVVARPDCDAVLAAGLGPSVCLPRLLRHRLQHERQAKCAGDLDPAGNRARSRDPRSRHGRARRARSRRARDRRSLLPSRAVAVPTGKTDRDRRLQHRDTPAALELGVLPLSTWSREH